MRPKGVFTNEWCRCCSSPTGPKNGNDCLTPELCAIEIWTPQALRIGDRWIFVTASLCKILEWSVRPKLRSISSLMTSTAWTNRRASPGTDRPPTHIASTLHKSPNQSSSNQARNTAPTPPPQFSLSLFNEPALAAKLLNQ